MTTAFELASTAANAHLPWTIHQAGDPYAVYNSLSRASSRTQPTDASNVATRHDTADISGASALLALAETEAGSRAAHIEALRQHIANGTYTVSAYRAASSLLNSLL